MSAAKLLIANGQAVQIGVDVPRHKTTRHYLEQLKDRNRYAELWLLYEKWSVQHDTEALSRFLEFTWAEKDGIKQELGEATYNNLRGIAFEEFCFQVLRRTIQDAGAEGMVELFWNEKILTEEFYLFEDGHFKRFPKYKTVDLAIGKLDGDVIHPCVVISCKTWQSTNWLDEDRAVFDSIRLRYPGVLGYSLCATKMSVPRASLISAQRTGLRVCDLSDPTKFEDFRTDIEKTLRGLLDSANQPTNQPTNKPTNKPKED